MNTNERRCLWAGLAGLVVCLPLAWWKERPKVEAGGAALLAYVQDDARAGSGEVLEVKPARRIDFQGRKCWACWCRVRYGNGLECGYWVYERASGYGSMPDTSEEAAEIRAAYNR